MSTFYIDAKKIETLHQTISKFPISAEAIINDILHEDGSELIQGAIKKLIPVSEKKNGKHAAHSKSLTDEKGNLFIIVKAKKDFYYLCFPDGGTLAQEAQEFFLRGGESQQEEIINRCLYMIQRRLGD